jgi:hypothetical protein
MLISNHIFFQKIQLKFIFQNGYLIKCNKYSFFWKNGNYNKIILM